jgi:hypothetical protein
VNISDAAGITPVHANRMIQQLRAINLIKWAGPSIRVLDFDCLKAVAEFDESYLHLRPPSTIARKHSRGHRRIPPGR